MSWSKPDEYDKMKSGKSSQKVLFMKWEKREKKNVIMLKRWCPCATKRATFLFLLFIIIPKKKENFLKKEKLEKKVKQAWKSLFETIARKEDIRLKVNSTTFSFSCSFKNSNAADYVSLNRTIITHKPFKNIPSQPQKPRKEEK